MNTQQTEIDVLKAQVKTLKRIVYGVVCLLVAGIALAATSMQGPTSGNFTDVTCTSLTVFDDQVSGGIAAILSADGNGGFLHTRNMDGKVTTELFSDGDGDGQVEVWNSEGNMCAEQYGDSDGDGRLRIYAADGTEVVDLYANSDGVQLDINNNDENLVATLGAWPKGGELHINNNDGKTVFQKP